MKILAIVITVLFSTSLVAQSWLDKECPDLDQEINVVDFESSKDRNVLDILINQSDEILVNGEAMPKLNSEIPFKEFVLEFVTNPNNNKTKAESPSKAFIRLSSYNKTTSKLEKLDTYIKEVYLYLWNTEGQDKYKSSYAELSCKKREKIVKSFPLRLVTDKSLKSNLNQKPANRIGVPPFGGDVKEN